MHDNIVTFPPAERENTESDVDGLNAEAFRDLEGRLSDCV
jgi:hypothetical protein